VKSRKFATTKLIVMAGLVPAIHAFTDIRQSRRPVIAGQKAPTGPREARPDDRLRAVFAPEDPAIHDAHPQFRP
jgi:hypothetical protein